MRNIFGRVGFNPRRMANTFVENKAKRLLVDFLEGIGQDDIRYLVLNDKDFTDYIPREQLLAHRSMIKAQFNVEFSPDEVWSWVPEEYKAIIEAQPKGREWADRQFVTLRETLLS